MHACLPGIAALPGISRTAAFYVIIGSPGCEVVSSVQAAL
jgi:hypothetical protein